MKSLENTIRQVMARQAEPTEVVPSLASTIRNMRTEQRSEPQIVIPVAEVAAGDLYEPGFDEVPVNAVTVFGLTEAAAAQSSKAFSPGEKDKMRKARDKGTRWEGQKPGPDEKIRSKNAKNKEFTVQTEAFTELLTAYGISEEIINGILEVHGVFLKGGSIGSQGGDKPISTHANPEDAKAKAGRMNKILSKGEKQYYGMKYHVKPIKEEAGYKVVKEDTDPPTGDYEDSAAILAGTKKPKINSDDQPKFKSMAEYVAHNRTKRAEYQRKIIDNA
jgi:hypothetical protein